MKQHIPAILFILTACGGAAHSDENLGSPKESQVLQDGGNGGTKSLQTAIENPPSDTGGSGGSGGSGVAGSGSNDPLPPASDAGAGNGGQAGTGSNGGSAGAADAGTGGVGGTGNAAGAGGSGGDSGPPPAECTSGDVRCSTDTQTQACVDGQWQNTDNCPYACQDGQCVGSCTDGVATCHGLDSVLCVNNEFVLQQTCDFVCSGAGVCSGECTPGSVDCQDQSRLTCGANGTWSAFSCPFLCSAGQCTGVCTPGDVRCSPSANTEWQSCGNDGQWVDQPCPTTSHTQSICQGAAVCATSCSNGWYDCNSDLSDGCEVADGLSNCGGCGLTCSTSSGGSSLASFSISSGTSAFDMSQDLAVWAVDTGNFVQINMREFGGSSMPPISINFTGRPGTIFLKHAVGSKFVVQRNTRFVVFDVATGDNQVLADNTIGTLTIGSNSPNWVVDGQFFYYLTGSSSVPGKVNDIRTIDLASHDDTFLGGYLQADSLSLSGSTIMLQFRSTPRFEAITLPGGNSSAWNSSGNCAPLAAADDVMFVNGDTLISNGCKYSISSHAGGTFGATFNKLVTGDSQSVYFVNKSNGNLIQKYLTQGAGSPDFSIDNGGPVLQMKISGSYLYWIDSTHVWRTAK